MKKPLLTSLVLVSILFAWAFVQASEIQSLTIRAATANPQGSLHVVAIDKFAELIEQRSEGQIKVRKFYDGVMGDEQENVRQLRTGEIQLAVLSCGNLTPFSPSAGVLYLPYVFPSIYKAHKLFSDMPYMKKLNNRIAIESGATPLAWLTGGYRQITNNKHHIHNLPELQDLHIRIPSVKLQLFTFRAWGIEPHIVPWTETYFRLKQGVIDGQENPYSIIVDQKFWEVQKYITETHYMLWVGPILVSARWFRQLNEPTQKMIEQAAKEAAEYEWAWAMKEDSIAKQRCISMGMEVVQLEDEDEWEDAARGIWPVFYEDVGGKDRIDELLERIK